MLQEERFFLVRIDLAAPAVHNSSPESIVAHGWWKLSDMINSEETIYPKDLASRLTEHSFIGPSGMESRLSFQSDRTSDEHAQSFRLVRCAPDGNPVTPLAPLHDELVANCQVSAELYRRIGYLDPWVSYVAVSGDVAVGGGAFVGSPKDGRVEIAYFTLPEYQSRGYGGRIAAGLAAIARTTDPSVSLNAFTLMKRTRRSAYFEGLVSPWSVPPRIPTRGRSGSGGPEVKAVQLFSTASQSE